MKDTLIMSGMLKEGTGWIYLVVNLFNGKNTVSWPKISPPTLPYLFLGEEDPLKRAVYDASFLKSSVYLWLVFMGDIQSSLNLTPNRLIYFSCKTSETYLEPYQTYKIERFAKIVNVWKLLTIFDKRTILDVWQGSECVFKTDFFLQRLRLLYLLSYCK